MDNIIVKSVIMLLSEDKNDILYKDGSLFSIKHKWWDDNEVKNKLIPVTVNFSLHKDNIIGVVTKLEKKNNQVVATMVIDGSDDDVIFRINNALYLAGIKSVKTDKNGMKIGLIQCVGMTTARVYPYRDKNFKWMLESSKKTKESAACKKSFILPKRSVESIIKG